jgi:hypothetical protein
MTNQIYLDVIIRIQKDIVQLQVTMHYFVAMQGANTMEYLDSKLHNSLQNRKNSHGTIQELTKKESEQESLKHYGQIQS